MSRGTRARDRQRHRRRAYEQLKGIRTSYLIDELVRRSGIHIGSMTLQIKDGHFTTMETSIYLDRELTGLRPLWQAHPPEGIPESSAK